MSDKPSYYKLANIPLDNIPPEASVELENYRYQLDQFDDDLAEAIGNRFRIVSKIGELKARYGIPTIQPVRAQAVIDRAADRAPEHGLSPAFMRKIYEVIIDYAHDLEKDIQGEE